MDLGLAFPFEKLDLQGNLLPQVYLVECGLGYWQRCIVWFYPICLHYLSMVKLLCSLMNAFVGFVEGNSINHYRGAQFMCYFFHHIVIKGTDNYYLKYILF